MSTLLSVRRQKAGKPMKHNGGWQTKEFVYPMKRLVNGDSYAKSYPFEAMIYSLAICYRIVLHMKVSLLMVSWQKL